jgi:putative transcriptional regulator
MPMTPIKVARLADPRTLTQKDVAAGCGIVPSFYSKIEAGEAKPSPEVAARLAAFLNHGISEMQILYPERYMVSGEAA